MYVSAIQASGLEGSTAIIIINIIIKYSIFNWVYIIIYKHIEYLIYLFEFTTIPHNSFL
jgi:hypothetical protein